MDSDIYWLAKFAAFSFLGFLAAGSGKDSDTYGRTLNCILVFVFLIKHLAGSGMDSDTYWRTIFRKVTGGTKFRSVL